MEKNKKEIIKTAIGKVKLVDAGVKNKYELECSPCSSDDNKERIYYPSLYLSSKEAPMLIGTEVEDEVTMIVKGVITSHSVNENQNRKKEDFTLEIKKIGVVSTKQNEDEIEI